MKHRLFLLVFGLWAVGQSQLFAQQDPLFSQYMFNRLALNPAYAGCKQSASFSTLYRHQWTGFDNAPRTFVLSGHTSFSNMRMGAGGYIMYDQAGPLSYLSFAGSYAYRIRLARMTYLSFGVSAGLSQYRVDGSEITTFSEIQQGTVDPIFTKSSQVVWQPEATAGAFFNMPNFYAGISARLFEYDVRFYDGSDRKRFRSYMFTSGVDIRLSNSTILTPSVFLRYEWDSFQADLNANLMFIQKFWVGAGYRTQDAVVFMAGFYPHPQFRIGYAYDLGVSALRTAHSGSHEIMLSLDLGNPNRSRVVTPRYF
jgi:type IX secretion system PorP/SprF family membrane protein